MSSDDKLEEMLRQAALLEAQMKSSISQRGRSSREGSVQTSSVSDERDSGSRASAAAPPVDMLRQAELLSQKMRSSRQHAFASAVGADDSDVSVDDMLRKAELLSLKMKSPVSSPPRGISKSSMTPAALEGTPGLIRQSERILSTMLHDHRSSNREMTTPELMRQTEHLLAKMRASSQASGSRGSHSGETSSFASDVLSNPDAFIAKMKADRHEDSSEKPVSIQQRGGGGQHDATRSEELKRLMEEALTSWTGSNEEKGRVKDALEQIVPNLESTPQTPSTVSIQQPEPDEISSVGSLSPRTRKSNLRVKSLLDSSGRPPLSPTNSYDVDAAEELVRNMAIALREARFGDAGHEGVIPSTPPTRPVEESGSHDEQPTPPSRPPHAKNQSRPPPPSVPPLTKTPTSPKTPSAARNVRPPPPPTESLPEKPRSSVSFTPTPRLPMSSEEAQYNAIMQAIDSSASGRARVVGKGGIGRCRR